MQVKEKPRDNDRLKFRPEYQNVEADFWKVKYLEAVIELQNANRGIDKLVKRKKMWGNTARACKKVRDESIIEGYEKGIARERSIWEAKNEKTILSSA